MNLSRDQIRAALSQVRSDLPDLVQTGARPDRTRPGPTQLRPDKTRTDLAQPG